ncbi:MAG: hypothetical protein ACREL6_12365, partial [Gemmatimonadales bacterium]
MDNRRSGGDRVSMTMVADFEKFAANGAAAAGDPAWLLPLRREAFARFRELGIPTPRNEDWKFTNVTPLAARPIRLAHEGSALTARDLVPFEFAGADWTELVFVNGLYRADLSRTANVPEGVL